MHRGLLMLQVYASMPNNGSRGGRQFLARLERQPDANGSTDGASWRLIQASPEHHP